MGKKLKRSMMNPYSEETMIAEMKFKLERSDDTVAEFFTDCLRGIHAETKKPFLGKGLIYKS